MGTGGQRELHLELDLEPIDRSITGRLRDELGEEHTFTGWLGLIAALLARLSKLPRSTHSERSTGEDT